MLILGAAVDDCAMPESWRASAVTRHRAERHRFWHVMPCQSVPVQPHKLCDTGPVTEPLFISLSVNSNDDNSTSLLRSG